MPLFDIKQKESQEVAKATFDKKEDYKVVKLVSVKKVDGKDVKTESAEKLLHVIQADRLIAKGKAIEVKGAKLEEREVETVVTPIKAE